MITSIQSSNCCKNPDIGRNLEQRLVCRSCGLVFIDELPLTKDCFWDNERINDLCHFTRSIFIGKLPVHEHKSKYSRLIKIGRSTTREKQIINKSKLLINQICGNLEIPEHFQRAILKVFINVWNKLPPKIPLRNPEQLIPTLLYLYSRSHKLGLSINDIVEQSCLSKNELFKNIQQLQKIIKLKLKLNDQTHLIRLKIDEICNKANLDQNIRNEAQELLEKSNKNTIVPVIAVALTYIALRNNNNNIRVFRLIDICDLSVSSYSIQTYLKEYFGFSKHTKFSVFENSVWKEEEE